VARSYASSSERSSSVGSLWKRLRSPSITPCYPAVNTTFL
jgi:hypothetical protein